MFLRSWARLKFYFTPRFPPTERIGVEAYGIDPKAYAARSFSTELSGPASLTAIRPGTSLISAGSLPYIPREVMRWVGEWDGWRLQATYILKGTI